MLPKRAPGSRDQPSGSSTPEEATRAFDAMVREHYARLCAFAFRFAGNREGAEDLVHEVLLRVWRRRVRFNYADPLPYLYQALRNEAVSQRRRRATEERTTAQIERDEHDRVATNAADGVDHALATAVADAVDALPERCRMVFTMHREQELRYADIARLLGISEKTVENQMSRAFKALRRRLAPFLGGPPLASVRDDEE